MRTIHKIGVALMIGTIGAGVGLVEFFVVVLYLNLV